jgi:PLP dependent protein
MSQYTNRKKSFYFAGMSSNAYLKIKSTIPSSVKLIVVSKFRSIQEIKAIYDAGHRDFAENRVQALLERKNTLPDDINWHLIGHLQTNKVKLIVPFVSMIQSVDSLKLMQEINKHAALNNRIVPCMLQIKISKEESKFGFDYDDLYNLLKQNLHLSFTNISWHGVMGMSTLTEDKSLVEAEFTQLKQFYLQLKNDFFNSNSEFTEVSMGMSGDYQLAIEYGSSMIRIGSAVFEKG